MKPNHKSIFFVTGISTDVGKTLASAIVVQALQADYWKPIQSGDLGETDSSKIRQLTSFPVVIHPESYALKTPLSPHAAAEIEGVQIDINSIIEPRTANTLVIEGAGGLLVPLNQTQTILDLIKSHHKVILVSRHYLGSINHTLMTVNTLRQYGRDIAGIIFNGDENPSTERVIQSMTGLTVIGRIGQEEKIDKQTVVRYAQHFQTQLQSL